MKELIGDEKQHQAEKKICECIGGRERGECHKAYIQEEAEMLVRG